jgi:hypothetical protein
MPSRLHYQVAIPNAEPEVWSGRVIPPVNWATLILQGGSHIANAPEEIARLGMEEIDPSTRVLCCCLLNYVTLPAVVTSGVMRAELRGEANYGLSKCELHWSHIWKQGPNCEDCIFLDLQMKERSFSPRYRCGYLSTRVR